MITVYGYPRSRSTRVVWMLEELGVEYQFRKVDLMKGEGQGPDYQQINPGGKVPTLDHDGFVLTESAAILTYLGDQYPQSGLVPSAEDSEARARYNEWCFFVLTELEQPLWTIGKHTFVHPEDKRVPEILPLAQWEFDRVLRVLDCKLAGREFALGDRFSAIDILITHILRWAHAFKVNNAYEQLTAYRDRHSSRPALERTLACEDQA